MSIHRHAARRDGNEPTIRKRFTHHGWHTEQLSIEGMPDLLCWPKRTRLHTISGHPAPNTCLSLSVLVDVKEPSGKPTPAQVKKWTALSEKGIPVYVARTVEDVDAIVDGTAESWGVLEARPKRGGLRTPSRLEGSHKLGTNYTPPRSLPVDAAREAEETFAPPPNPLCSVPHCWLPSPCKQHGGA